MTDDPRDRTIPSSPAPQWRTFQVECVFAQGDFCGVDDRGEVRTGDIRPKREALCHPAGSGDIVILGLDPRIQANVYRKQFPRSGPDRASRGDATRRGEWIRALWSECPPKATSAGLTIAGRRARETFARSAVPRVTQPVRETSSSSGLTRGSRPTSTASSSREADPTGPAGATRHVVANGSGPCGVSVRPMRLLRG